MDMKVVMLCTDRCVQMCFTLFRTIPPEQQAEADELAVVLSELQATTMHEYQEVVGGQYNNKHKCFWLMQLVEVKSFWVFFQNVKNDSITEWKAKIAEKTQKLVCDTNVLQIHMSLFLWCFADHVFACIRLRWKWMSATSRKTSANWSLRLWSLQMSWRVRWRRWGRMSGTSKPQLWVGNKLAAAQCWCWKQAFVIPMVCCVFSGGNGWVCGGAAEHGPERDPHWGRDPADVQPTSGPGEQYEQHKAATGRGMIRMQVLVSMLLTLIVMLCVLA